jgi:hypothetical protein
LSQRPRYDRQMLRRHLAQAAHPSAAALTRIVSKARIWLDSRKSIRSFKEIICVDISEFASSHPSHAVRSLWGTRWLPVQRPAAAYARLLQSLVAAGLVELSAPYLVGAQRMVRLVRLSCASDLPVVADPAGMQRQEGIALEVGGNGLRRLRRRFCSVADHRLQRAGRVV